jgi:hypothetical protein
MGVIDLAAMASWKKVGVGVVLAGAVTVALIVILAGPKPARSNPPPEQPTAWNSHAIRGTLAGIRVREIDGGHAAVVFLYDLENTTNADYRLTKGPNLVIMSRLKSSRTLSGDEPIALNSTAFVPAQNRTRIALEVSHVFSWPGQRSAYAERMFNQLVAGDVADVAGFVLFDQTNRYEIDFPASWPETQAASSAP